MYFRKTSAGRAEVFLCPYPFTILNLRTENYFYQAFSYKGLNMN